MGRFDGQTVIVTGVARGLGASHVRGFVTEGASLLIADRADTAKRLRRPGLQPQHVIVGAYPLRCTKHPKITIAAMGALVTEALAAADRLAQAGIETDVVCVTSPRRRRVRRADRAAAARHPTHPPAARLRTRPRHAALSGIVLRLAGLI